MAPVGGNTAVAVGVDVGGTKLVAGAVDARGRAGERRRETTPLDDGATLVATIVAMVADLDAASLPLGIGVAGIVDDVGTYRYGPNLPFRDLALADDVRSQRPGPVRVVNDVTAAVVAEQRVGAATGHDDVVMFTLGTGVGGGVVVGGEVVTGRDGAAGELGHLVVAEGGRRCPCGNRGCLEAYASGRALAVTAAERLAEWRGGSSLADVDELDGKAVTTAALDGDVMAREVLAEAGFWLGVGAASIVNALDPAIVVVGGGASATATDLLLPPARDALAARLIGREVRYPPPLVPAALGDDAGMIGAALLAADGA